MELMPPEMLADIRSMVDRWLIDELEVWRGSSSDLNETTLSDEHVPGSQVWSGRGRVRPTRGPQELAVHGGVAQLRNADINLDLSCPALFVDDEIKVVSSGDDTMIGRWFRVTDVRAFTQQASRKVSAIQIQGSRLWGVS